MPPPLVEDQLTVADITNLQQLQVSKPNSIAHNDVYSNKSEIQFEGALSGIRYQGGMSCDNDTGIRVGGGNVYCEWCTPNECVCDAGNNPWDGICDKEIHLLCDNDKQCLHPVNNLTGQFCKVSLNCDIPCDTNTDCYNGREKEDNLTMDNPCASEKVIDCKEGWDEPGNLDAQADGECILQYSGFTENLWAKSQRILDSL